MDPITQQTVLAAAGAGGEDKDYVDDVFSTDVFEGTGTTHRITNGLDLAGEGGLVWIKRRDGTDFHRLWTDDNFYRSLSSSRTDAYMYGSLETYNNDGYTMNSSGTGWNESNADYVSWSFRKAPGFFDVVTYTGNGSVQNISHSLGSVPGMIIVKNTDAAGNFQVYHRNTGPTKKLELNEDAAAATNSGVWNNTTPTASVFTVGTNISANGANYIAYIFAHDDAVFGADEDESIIKCGSYTGTGSTNNTINLGFEPQWVMIKNSSTSGRDWMMLDNMRGVATGSGVSDYRLWANSTSAESGYDNAVDFTSTGFKMMTTVENTSGNNYIYMAIRRPHKPPAAATDVFSVGTGLNAGGNGKVFNSGFPVDLHFSKQKSSSNSWHVFDRLRGNQSLSFNTTSAESQLNYQDQFDHMDGIYTTNTFNYTDWIGYEFKRAPGFFDVVAYTGNASTNNVTHNLQAVPELMIFKNRDQGIGWPVWFGDGSNIVPLQGSNAKYDEGLNLNGTTATNIPISSGNSSYNNNGINYIAYLFATLPGISKVGSYTGNDTNVRHIDCGFTNGARFVMVKRTDSTGDWYVWDSTRGINDPGNDPYLLLNTTDAQVTGTDYIQSLSSGFSMKNGSIWNASGGTYIFLAIA